MLVSAVQWSESTIRVHISPSLLNLPLHPSLSHPSRSSQRTELSSLCFTAASQQQPVSHVVVVQSFSPVRLFVTPWTAAHQACLSFTTSQSLLMLKPVNGHESGMASNHLILCCLLLPLPSIFPSIRVFSNESVLHVRWPKYWSFSFTISPSNECSGLISFRMDWLDFLAVQGTLKSLLQHHNLKASILQHSVFFIVQLSHPYITTGKTIALTAAAAAKSFQSCPTLCNPIDGSPPGSPIPGILQARTLEWVAISFSNAWKWKLKVKLLSRVQLLATPWTAAYQALPSMGFFQARVQEWVAIAFSIALTRWIFVDNVRFLLF